MNSRTPEKNPFGSGRFLLKMNKRTRKFFFFFVVVIISAFIWLLGWFIEFIFVNLWNLIEWIITAI